jgi:DNA-binding transcriptional ArsR family regulator
MAGPEYREHRDEENHYRCAALMHPQRHRILCLLADDEEFGVDEIAAELNRPPGTIVYHLRLLTRRGALKVVPKCRPARPLYRWSPQARWVREMLDEIDEQGLEGS